uniref:Uncharacterized protein n=1 Tax=Tanacetum cinerariifolium TaxID=118510 RepID=A0A6L2NS81_TANCI|nr:hypothetical protein [Tanacetum cinerariifolium]
MVMVKIPRYVSWLGSTNIYDEHLGDLDKMEDEVGNSSRQSTPQILPSFKEYTPPVTYPEEVEETLGIPMEIEPFDQMKIEDVGLDTRNHDIPLSSREVPIFDEPEPQLQPLPCSPSLDVSLSDERGPKPPIKPRSLDSFRMKAVDNLIIPTPPSPHVASFHLKDVYCYYHPSFGKHLEEKHAVQGEENSIFFLSTLKYNLLIVINVNEVWVVNLKDKKTTALEHFAARFKENAACKHKFRRTRFRKLSPSGASFLESTIAINEIKSAVWECDRSKESGD